MFWTIVLIYMLIGMLLYPYFVYKHAKYLANNMGSTFYDSHSLPDRTEVRTPTPYAWFIGALIGSLLSAGWPYALAAAAMNKREIKVQRKEADWRMANSPNRRIEGGK